MKFKLLVPSLLAALSLNVSAHGDGDAVSITDFLLSRSPATAPSYRFDITSASEVDFDDGSGSFSYQRLRLDIPLTKPLHLNDNNALLIGTSYKGTDLDSTLGDQDLHDFRVSFRWIYRDGASRWSWMTVLSPGVVMDGNDIGSDDFSVNGRVGFRYAQSDNFSWLGGVVFFS